MIHKYRVLSTGDIILHDDMKHILTNKSTCTSVKIPVTDLRHVMSTLLMEGEIEEITNGKTNRR